MPQPWTYRHASHEYRAILDDLKERMALVSDNMAYTAMDGVFQVFRQRVTAVEGLTFASVLPCVPRAILVAGWIPRADPLPWGTRSDWVAEARAVRKDHNLTPANCIEAVAWTLRRAVRAPDWDRTMRQLPQGAQDFWRVEVSDPRELHPGIR